MALRPDYEDVVGRGGRPRLSADDRTTDADEEGVALEAVGVKFPIGELLGSGTATVEGANIVAKARAEIVKLRGQVAQLVALRKDGAIDQDTLGDQLLNPNGGGPGSATGKWVDAETQIKTIFGDAHGDLEEVLNENRVVAAFDRLVAALSSVEAFTAATDADGPDYITGFQGRNASQAEAAFGRNASTATAVLSVLGDVRYGAATFNETAKATDGLGTAETGQAFAYATIPAVQRASDVQVAGNAYYTGGTHAIDAEGNLYTGDIAVEVRFTAQQVTALVSGLADVDSGAPWMHGFGGEVMNIWLPDAQLSRVGTWAGWNGDARLSYERRAGGAPDVELTGRAEFSGRLLGRGDEAGEQAVGVWSLDGASSEPMLAGAFGAQRGPDRLRPSQKLLDDLEMVGASVTRDSMDPVGAEDDDITLALNPNNNNLKITFADDVEYTLHRGTLLDGGFAPTSQDHAAQSARHEVRKDTHVKGVRETFGKTARQLASVVALDTADADSLRPTLHAQRQRLFDVLQGELRKLFGNDIAGDNPGDDAVWADPNVLGATATPDPAPAWQTDAARWNNAHADYPVSSGGVPQDGQLAGRIEDVQAALADVEAFVDAFGTGGVFDAYDNENTQRPGFLGARAVWDLAASRLLLWTDRTDFTRFGAWSRQTSADGATALTAASQGVFAYSPLALTAAYASATERGYPGADLRNAQSGKVLATYLGRTTAVGGDVFYEGEVEALVEWDTTAVAGSLVFTIDSLVPTDPRFEAMRHGPADLVDEATGEITPKLGTRDVRSLEFRADIAAEDGKLEFSSTAAPKVTVGGLVQQTPLAEGSYSNELVQVPYRGGRTIPWREAQSFPVTFDSDAPVEMVAHADGAARYRGGGPDRMPLVITDMEIDHRTNWFANNEWHRLRTAKGDLSIYNGNFADGSQIGRWGDARGGPWVPHWESSRGFSARISQDYDDLEIPTYMVTNGNWRIHRYADGSIWVGRSNPSLSILGVQSRPLEPDMPNAAQTYGEANRPTDQWILTSAGASTMLKSWLERTGGVNLWRMPPTGSALNGQFVGQDADGPTGMIGTWELPEGAFGAGDVRVPIRGSFGAEYAP